MKNYVSGRLLLLLLFILFGISKVFALGGAIGSHDPGALVKEGNRYWMFTTGRGIYAAYSTDLFGWTSSPTPVFPGNTWPAWINTYVPGFEGTFWAPEAIFMNGKYYLYYSCSTFGSSQSAIGLVTNVTLDPASPNYQWVDQGMVVSSVVNTDINAIDPALILDNGKVYMSYGSFSGGIGIVELDPVTGLRKAGASIVRVAGGNNRSWEAPYIFKEGNYFYLIVNRGACCNGVNSTYNLVMGRSTNIYGPYLDKNNTDLRTDGGGSSLLATSGRYIGPGHFGLLRENGINFVSIHYYDGNDNGAAKLDILKMTMENGWPVLSRNWLPQGRYRITNLNSGLSWGTSGCGSASGQAIEQGTWSDQLCQQWDFEPIGDGYYKITNAQSGLPAELQNNGTANGTRLQLGTWANTNNQKYRVERNLNGDYFFTPHSTNRVVEVPSASMAPGVQLVVWGHNGCNCQKWQLTPAGNTTSSVGELAAVKQLHIYPNPSRSGDFTIELDGDVRQVDMEIVAADGRTVYTGIFTNKASIEVRNKLRSGIYFIRIKRNDTVEVRKWLVQE